MMEKQPWHIYYGKILKANNMDKEIDKFHDMVAINLGDVKGAKIFARILHESSWWNSLESPWDASLEWNSLGNTIADNEAPSKLEDYEGIKSRVWVHPTAQILPGTYIEGPAIIGPECVVGPNCTLREFVYLDANVTVAQGAEIKASAVLEGSFLSHFCYLGHSLLGRRCSFSAGVITSTKRFDSNNIFVKWKGVKRDTGKSKVGAIIGDNVLLGVGVLIMPGKTIGPDSWVLPGTVVNFDIPQGHRPTKETLVNYESTC